MKKEQTLQELLEEKGVTQRSLCNILHLSESQVSLLISGKRRMSFETGMKIAQKLRVSPTTVFLSLNFAKCKENS
ncbi:helix-turn-helix transcriptional regulator [uncultured Megasphaera sp.]|jgi:plasmid maintenance system antidote protein VapI|uniref:helix-turn-helix transcriptional regulator n=1 Tax=uncultured Megasphaera sp. TaxID=165188 RepID=UPI00266F2047|nr:helix-turn-helix transcriptional regulator [uncultured Megasphaera sp.]